MIARLEHPHILPVYDFGEVNASPYIVMRFMTGGSLQERFNDGLGRSEALRLLEQIAQALDFARPRHHPPRYQSRPTSCWTRSGNAYLADFGLAKTISGTQDLTATGSTRLAGLHVAGASARWDTDRRATSIPSPFWSTGFSPVGCRSRQTPLGVSSPSTSQPPVPIRRYMPDLPQAADDVLAAGLSKDPMARPSRATEVLANLKAALIPGVSSTMVSPTAPSAAPLDRRPPPPPTWRLPALLAGGAVALLVIGGLAAIVLYLAGNSLRSPHHHPSATSRRALRSTGRPVWWPTFSITA
jgi:serine/threonine-protein kinase